MPIEQGDRVRLDYVGRFEDGTVFATSRPAVATEHDLLPPEEGDPTPLSFTVGAAEVIDGLESAVIGMKVGAEATVRVPPEEAYGEHDPDRVREYDPEAFEAMVGEPPEIGTHVEAKNDLHGDVTAVTDESVQVDFNHELAGRTLRFDIEVLDVESARGKKGL
ncbi:FKBP-type peptidylprolyl isomerase [Natronomonas moolapensis 8.8.11]|uniref:Peptidyl-prolyl cis-trans isomerase n=1 Tax=Natronomonas moolapensis (strain DSM 18674 / CECT 7526 / JCM 14361 / 8.8.11) TaxID=268739 RepID=M1XTH2_NATM8|nr:peptidylprolyl isomerase [Natronomonas moolapensis]CCQ37765.1 FKBP-type peptidylprolyl isomerase [Natronomonas moolapensis 8.8.11]